jgi:hypothetical protein
MHRLQRVPSAFVEVYESLKVFQLLLSSIKSERAEGMKKNYKWSENDITSDTYNRQCSTNIFIRWELNTFKVTLPVGFNEGFFEVHNIAIIHRSH